MFDVMQEGVCWFWTVLVLLTVLVQWFCCAVRKNAAAEEEHEGAGLRPLPPACSGMELWAVLPVWDVVSPSA